MSTTRCAYGGTYPELVKFAKGHGTQNDFVLLPDLDAGLRADARRGGRPVRPAPGTRRRRRAAGDDGRRRAGRGRLRPAARRGRRPTTGTWTTATPTARSRRCAATAFGFSPTTCGPAGLESRDEFVVGSLAGPRPVVLHGWDATNADVTVEMGKTNQLGTGEAIVGGRTVRRPGRRRRQPAPGMRRPRPDRRRAGRARRGRAGVGSTPRSSPTASTSRC